MTDVEVAGAEETTTERVDRLLREGRTHDAVNLLELSARQLASSGEPLKAIAHCRRALQIVPGQRDTARLLAYLYTRHLWDDDAQGEVNREQEAAAPDPTDEERSTSKVIVDRALMDGEESGDHLDSLQLRKVIPGARATGPVRVGRSSRTFKIPLSHEVDAVLVEMTKEVTAPQPKLPKTPLFSDLDPAALQDLIEQIELRNYSAGETIIQQGDQGDALFVLAEGEVEVSKDGPPRRVLTRLEEGAFFGEIALLTRSERTATITAITPATALIISHELVQGLIERHPGMLVVLLKFFKERLLDTLLDTSYLFATLTAAERRELAEKFDFVEVEPGSEMLVAGQEGSVLHILLCGRMRWRRAREEEWSPLPPGAIFGVRTMVCSQQSQVDVSSVDKCWLLQLEKSDFLPVAKRFPQFISFIESLALTQDPKLDEERDSSGLMTQKINLPIF